MMNAMRGKLIYILYETLKDNQPLKPDLLYIEAIK